MHPLHDYISKQLSDRLKDRVVVVWYDERGEFLAFVDEVRGGAAGALSSVELGGKKTRLAEYTGSLFELRAGVETCVSGNFPDRLVVYLPGIVHDTKGSVLMELEKAGTTWKPALRQLARNLLLRKYTQGTIDEMLLPERKLSYADLARLAEGESGVEPPSVLKTIFPDKAGKELLAIWLTNDTRDADIVDKEAVGELVKLIKAILGLTAPPDISLAKLRAMTLRYVLAGEFRLDLSCDPPATLNSVPSPTTKKEEAAVRDLALRLRSSFPNAYTALADKTQEELRLHSNLVPASALGAVDTFRFEERALLCHACELICVRRFEQALAVIDDREDSFWVARDLERKAQWEATRQMAELGRLAEEVQAHIKRMSPDSASWVGAYVAEDGWFRLDQAQRRLEAWVAKLDEEPDERTLRVVRQAYEDACYAMTEGFVRTLTHNSKWNVPGILHQTNIWNEVVAERPKPVAYLLVDAMRYEMGVELANRLPRSSEVSLRPALGALPTITPIGMAALMPAASATFTVTEQRGKLGALIDGTFLPDLPSRKKFAAARVPKLFDIGLDALLSLQRSDLAKKLKGAPVIIVRSQEIDHAGETGFTYQARQVMDTVIDNLVRAVRKLSASGVEQVVIAADHGHLFFSSDRNESMRIEAPGGETVELHRRCWIGRGGTTPPGCVRVAGAALGYSTDLEMIFPLTTGVFKSGGGLAYHHGGPSLQELVLPVLSVRTPSAVKEHAASKKSAITARSLPDLVTNRIFSVTFEFEEIQMSLEASSILIRPLLLAEGRQVGAVGMAVDAELDRETGCVRLEPDKAVTVAFLLSDDSIQSLHVAVLDPSTDAELYRSPREIQVRLGV